MAIPITLRKKIADFDPIREGITVQQFCKNIGVSKQTYYNCLLYTSDAADE